MTLISDSDVANEWHDFMLTKLADITAVQCQNLGGFEYPSRHEENMNTVSVCLSFIAIRLSLTRMPVPIRGVSCCGRCLMWLQLSTNFDQNDNDDDEDDDEDMLNDEQLAGQLATLRLQMGGTIPIDDDDDDDGDEDEENGACFGHFSVNSCALSPSQRSLIDS